MTLFGFTLVKTDKLNKVLNAANDLSNHVWSNAGFVNEKGVLQNTTDDNESNPTVKAHWSKFHELDAILRKGLK